MKKISASIMSDSRLAYPNGYKSFGQMISSKLSTKLIDQIEPSLIIEETPHNDIECFIYQTSLVIMTPNEYKELQSKADAYDKLLTRYGGTNNE